MPATFRGYGILIFIMSHSSVWLREYELPLTELSFYCDCL